MFVPKLLKGKHLSLSDRDRQLGMVRPISRRDFLNGVAMATAGLAATALLPKGVLAQSAAPAANDPAKLTGLRGHSEAGERYDPIVVGGGISGLAGR